MKSKIIVFCMGLILSSIALANHKVNVSCPSVFVIKAIGIENIKYNGLWIGTTNVFAYKDLKWRFYISAPLDAKNQTDAIKQLNDKISGLEPSGGPYHDDSDPTADSWWCAYAHHDDNRVGATSFSIPVPKASHH